MIKNKISKLNKKIIFEILILILISFLLRLLWLFYSKPIPVSDFLGYKLTAENILSNHIIGIDKEPSVYRLPLYPIFLSFFLLFSENNFFLSLINVILVSLSAGLVYILSYKIYDNRKIAFIGGLLYLINPTFIFFSSVLASENLFVFFLLLSIIFLVDFIKTNNYLFFYLSAILLGLSSLTRGEGIFYFPIFIIFILLFTKCNLKEKFLKSILFIVIFLLTLSPWLVRNKLVFNEFGLSSTGGINFYFAHNSDTYGCVPLENTLLKGLSLHTFEISKIGYKEGFNCIKREEFNKLLKDTIRGTYLLWIPDPYSINYSLVWSIMSHSIPINNLSKIFISILGKIAYWFYVFIFLFFIASLLIIDLKKDFKRNFLFILLILSNWFCNAVVFWAKARYRFFAEVIFCILAGYSIYISYNFIIKVLKNKSLFEVK